MKRCNVDKQTGLCKKKLQQTKIATKGLPLEWQNVTKACPLKGKAVTYLLSLASLQPRGAGTVQLAIQVSCFAKLWCSPLLASVTTTQLFLYSLYQGSPNFFLRGPDNFPFFNVGPGRSVMENYMGRSNYQYYCGDFKCTYIRTYVSCYIAY